MNWHQSRVNQRNRRARPPGVPQPAPVEYPLQPYARVGMVQVD